MIVRSDNCIIDADIMYNSESVSQSVLLEGELFVDCPDMAEDIKVAPGSKRGEPPAGPAHGRASLPPPERIISHR